MYACKSTIYYIIIILKFDNKGVRFGMEILTNNHYDKILDLFEGSTQKIKIISPFISESIAKKLCDIVKNSNIECDFITRFYLEDMFAKANSMDAIEMMMDAGIKVYALKGLHTKLYLFDDNYGIVGSANFTMGGFKSNIELSLLMDNKDVLDELHKYFDALLEELKQKNGLITKEVLELGRKKYNTTFSSKKGNNTTRSTFMWGASLDKGPNFKDDNVIIKELDKGKNDEDIVNSMFKFSEQQKQVIYDHTIWLKFSGESNDRFKPNEKYSMVTIKLNNKTLYLANYPFKVNSIKEGDEIYFAGLTTVEGRNEPVIVGRGYLQAFSPSNYMEKDWLKLYDWMDRFPWYCVVKDSKIINAPIKDCLKMDELWDKLGSDTYISSFGKNESIAEVSRKHYQKAHIRLSGNAKDYIDKRLDELEKKYGATRYVSEL
jgi:hypothetical protein